MQEPLTLMLDEPERIGTAHVARVERRAKKPLDDTPDKSESPARKATRTDEHLVSDLSWRRGRWLI
jgi:hypothetical protein